MPLTWLSRRPSVEISCRHSESGLIRLSDRIDLPRTNGLQRAAAGDEGVRFVIVFEMDCDGSAMGTAGNLRDDTTTVARMTDLHALAKRQHDANIIGS